MTEEPVVWALLASTSASWLQKQVDAFWSQRVVQPNHPKKWEVVPGAGAYSVVLNHNPGTDQTYEIPLAKKLSRELTEPVYVLYPKDAYTEVDSVYEYQGGREVGTEPDDAYSFANGLGVSLPGALPTNAKPMLRSVLLGEGVTADAAARALGFDSPPKDESLSIEDGQQGALVYSSTVGDLGMFANELSIAFPGQVIYNLSAGPTPGRFLVRMMRGGRTVGVFDFPNPVTFSSGGPPQLDAIKGQTDPQRIAEVLGVPYKLLN